MSVRGLTGKSDVAGGINESIEHKLAARVRSELIKRNSCLLVRNSRITWPTDRDFTMVTAATFLVEHFQVVLLTGGKADVSGDAVDHSAVRSSDIIARIGPVRN